MQQDKYVLHLPCQEIICHQLQGHDMFIGKDTGFVNLVYPEESEEIKGPR